MHACKTCDSIVATRSDRTTTANLPRSVVGWLVGYSPVLPQCLPVVVCCGLQRTPRRHARPGRRPLARVRAWQLNFMRDRPQPARCHARRLIRLRQRRLKERRPGAFRVPLLVPSSRCEITSERSASSLARPPAPPRLHGDGDDNDVHARACTRSFCAVALVC